MVREVNSDGLDMPWWPEDYESLALDVFERHRPEKARVAGFSSIVAHHEHFALGHRHWSKGAGVGQAWVEVRLLLTLAIHKEHPVLNRNFVSWQTYNALYQILLATLGAIPNALEDYDVVPLGFMEAVDELVDKNPVAYLKRWDHALRRDVESLDDERAYEAEDESEGDEEYNQKLHQAPALSWQVPYLGILRHGASNLSSAWVAHTHSYTTHSYSTLGDSGQFPRRLPLETVWKLETGPILKPHEWADRNQQALFSRLLVLPETTFNEPSSYFPDSL